MLIEALNRKYITYRIRFCLNIFHVFSYGSRQGTIAKYVHQGMGLQINIRKRVKHFNFEFFNMFLISSAHVVIGSQVRAEVHHQLLHDQSTFDEVDEDIYNENKRYGSKDAVEREGSETASNTPSEAAVEDYYVADNIKLRKPPPGSKIEALRDTIEQRVSATKYHGVMIYMRPSGAIHSSFGLLQI